MTDSLSPAEQLRRRYRPDRRRELVVDFEAQLAGVTDPAERQALYDAACELAGEVVGDAHAHAALTTELYQTAFPADVAADLATIGGMHAKLAQPDHQEALTVLAADIADADTDAERAEIAAAALASGAFADDPHAIQAVVAMDPTIGRGEDFDTVDAADRSLDARLFNEAHARLTPAPESRAMQFLNAQLEAAETAATEQEAANA